jgi:hypothetical protein
VPYGGSVTLTQDGDYLGSYVDHDVSRRELARHSERDADASLRYHTDIMKQCRFIRQFLLRTAPDPASLKAFDLYARRPDSFLHHEHLGLPRPVLRE